MCEYVCTVVGVRCIGVHVRIKAESAADLLSEAFICVFINVRASPNEASSGIGFVAAVACVRIHGGLLCHPSVHKLVIDLGAVPAEGVEPQVPLHDAHLLRLTQGHQIPGGRLGDRVGANPHEAFPSETLLVGLLQQRAGVLRGTEHDEHLCFGVLQHVELLREVVLVRLKPHLRQHRDADLVSLRVEGVDARSAVPVCRGYGGDDGPVEELHQAGLASGLQGVRGWGPAEVWVSFRVRQQRARRRVRDLRHFVLSENELGIHCGP
mmetsp:Transcript_29248/g.40410  ORF Transcript_29248/g.40410 Transcript_29248/m.40410 type:complete len:266 (+) Transcript_29248:1355-2152(+)